MAVVAVANTSTYIQGGIEYDAYVSGSNIVVNVRLYFRRTNAWSGQTSSSSVGEYICISGDPANYNYSQTGSITVAGGQQNVWQGAFFSASRTFDSSRGGNTIYVGWKTNDNVSSYFTGSNNVQITLPTVNTPPTGLATSNTIKGVESVTSTVSITGWGIGSGTKYKELQVWTYSSSGLVTPRRYQPLQGDSLSSDITVSNSSSGGDLVIRGNTAYVLGAYASNGSANTGSQRAGVFTTLAYPPSMSATLLDDTSVRINYALQADGGNYAKNVQYSLDNGNTWVTAATINTGSATTGNFTITGLTPDTSYTMKTRVSTAAGETDGADVTFKTFPPYEPHGDFYGSVNDVSRQINDFYGSVETTEIIGVTGEIRAGGAGNVTAFDGDTFWAKVGSSISSTKTLDYISLTTSTAPQMVRVSIYYTDGTTMGKSVVTTPTGVEEWGVTMSQNLVEGDDYIDLTPIYSTAYESTTVNKLYGSVGGESKLIHQSFGHIDYT